MSHRNKRNLQLRRRRLHRRNHRRDRRGVLLMVVLSMLALFLLLGTSFLVTSNFYKKTATEQAKLNRTTNNPTDLLERAMLQVLRDTNNPSSVVQGHSLLRDLYGTDGFIARVFVGSEAFLPKFAGATPGAPFGPTNGQIIELFMRDDGPGTPAIPEAGDVIELERAPNGQARDHDPSPAKSYHTGSVLTMLTGPAAGQSTRIVGYEYVGNLLWRIRVMAISKRGGQELTAVNPGASAALADFIADPDAGVGHVFMVNGRPYNGSGAGYNRLARPGTPRLSAVELMITAGGAIGTEMALTPNGRFVDVSQAAHLPLNLANPAISDPFGISGRAVDEFVALNPNPNSPLYPNPWGPGGMDESYDAADYQNMFLALMPLTPRAQAGIVNSQGTVFELGSSAANQLINDSAPMRFDLENTVLPSFHRPALVNFWYHRLLNAQWLANSGNPSVIASAIVAPYGQDGIRGNGDDPSAIPIELRDQIVAIKRKIMLRPIAEDHPNFDGSNPTSRANFSPVQGRSAPIVAAIGQIRTPFWEITGPWDVDNDNDGIADSVWVDLGDPVQKTEDGRLYKALYAFLIVDLDSRLNLNAHGSMAHMANTNFDPVELVTGQIGNLTGGDLQAQGIAPTLWSSNRMPQGLGWGPGDVSLRPILSPNLPFASPALVGNPNFDDLARLNAGRPPASPTGRAVFGRLGSHAFYQQTGTPDVLLATLNCQPGLTFSRAETGMIEAVRDLLTPFEFAGFPVADQLRSWRLGNLNFARPSEFATSPDLMGKYAIGIDYAGQPTYEAVWDSVNPNPGGNYLGLPFVPLVDDGPYEINLSATSPRGPPTGTGANPLFPSDDAPFAVAEMERLLRAHDPDTGTAPNRLWDVVDAFDPQKYVLTIAFNASLPTAEELALAQSITALNWRQVTTDSYEVPAPADGVPSYISELGPDGAPGIAGVDDSGNGLIDDVSEVGLPLTQYPPNGPWPDDFASFTGKSVAQARLVDVLWYRIQRERIKRGQQPFNPLDVTPGGGVAQLNAIAEQLLPPEVIAGYKMNLNRPFGDGRDNNGNGIVDEPIEAGEPWLDLNGDGVRQPNEPFIDLDGDGLFYQDKDGDQAIDLISFDGNITFEPIVDSLWQAQLGTPALVNHTMSKSVTGRGRYLDTNGNGVWDAGEPIWRDSGYLARQLYARHLYCLMLLLMDEDYVAPYNEADPQVRRYLNRKTNQLLNAPGSPYNQQTARLEAQRRYTCRVVAQWAVNCVDFRDSDAIMTPFEYDEYPWDGWNCIDSNTGTVIPLDGDPGTDENESQFIDWLNMSGDGVKVVSQLPTGELNPIDQTRSIVWGAERPELLITESLAWHDRRTEDTSLDPSGEQTTSGDQQRRDDDLDQRLRPAGRLFLEFYNPWSGDGQRPAELYRHTDLAQRPVDRNGDGNIDILDTMHPVDRNGDGNVDAHVEGVMLDKLSDATDDGTPTGRRSPVWRVIVVEEHPEYRSPIDDLDDNPETVEPASLRTSRWPEFRNSAGQKTRYSPIDPDWDEMFDRDATPQLGPTRQVTANNPENQQDTYQLQQFRKTYPYIEREFYFVCPTTDTRNGTARIPRDRDQFRKYTDLSGTDLQQAGDNLPYRIPYRLIQTDRARSFTHRFVSERGRNVATEIAPILPGRYAVAGSGFRYLAAGQQNGDLSNGTTAPRFIADFGRILGNNPGQTPDATHLNSLGRLRRFELLPSPNPFVQQLIVGPNGGDPMLAGRAGRANEMVYFENTGTLLNVFDAAGDDSDGTPDALVVQPVVAIPIDDMNISEPVYGYEVRERELDQLETVGPGPKNPVFSRRGANGEGAYRGGAGGGLGDQAYDTPFDIEPELVRTGTTPNYRTVHLQRLADPTKVWNPPPGRENHEPLLPVNPYLTIDAASVDLTAFNGASRTEGDLQTAANLLQWLPFGNAENQRGFADNFRRGRQAMHLKSLERGARAVNAASDANQVNRPLRLLWRQEEANVRDELKRLTAIGRSIATAPGANGVDGQEMHDRAKMAEHMHDIVVEHTIGYANQAYGRIVTGERGVAHGDPRAIALEPIKNSKDGTGDYRGMPVLDLELVIDPDGAPLAEDSTYPWFVWNDRPFVSGNELLQVPAASSSAMLRAYSTMNTEIQPADQPNPYTERAAGGMGSNDANVVNQARYASAAGHFGHLLNLFQSATDPAGAAVDNNGNPMPGGAPNHHRIMDYVHVPSRFVATDVVLNPAVFSANTTINPDDPRQDLLAPFNRVPEFREPGKVNLNTVLSRRQPGGGAIPVWSDVYDGLMHRVRDSSVMSGNILIQAGHFGPAWRDVALSRRGYVDPVVNPASGTGIDRTEMVLNNNSPTFFANPFRSSSAGDLVPLPTLVASGVEASMLRSHPFRPGEKFAWGTPEVDNNNNGLVDDATEAGMAQDDGPFSPQPTPAQVPLFSELSSTAAVDGTRNPGMHTMPLTRLDNLTTTRSGVFAVWVTVGYFEVTPAPDWNSNENGVVQKFTNQAGGDPNRGRALYNRVYPQGYQLGKELGAETGDVDRQRAFYIIDRTRPVAFLPGEDVNVEDAILLRRRIE